MEKIKILLLIIFQFLVVFAMAQTITGGEYFFDTDPGPGNGIAISITNGELVDENLEFSTSGLEPGYHYIYIRVNDENGKWSSYINHKFYIYEIIEPEIPSVSKPLVAAEYFFDTDPGTGNGIPFIVTKSDELDIERYISTAGLTPETHTLFVRVSDEDGKWSIVKSADFYTYDATCTVPVVDFTSDTVASGNEMTFTNLSSNVHEATSYSWDILNDSAVDYTALDILHTFAEAGRYDVKLTVNNGDACISSVIREVVVGTLASPIVSVSGDIEFCDGNSVTLTAETGHSYLWSTGETTQAIDVTSSGDYYAWITNSEGVEIKSETINVIVNDVPDLVLNTTDATDGIANGSAVLEVTGGSENYLISWSTGEEIYIANNLAAGDHSVTVDDGFCPLSEDFTIGDVSSNIGDIVAAEYFFDTDPGPGSGSTLNIAGGETINFTTSISTTGLNIGFHHLFIRVKDNEGRWSIYDTHKFYIYDTIYTDQSIETQIVAAEYFFNQDPGFGNGYPITISPGDSIDWTGEINPDTLSEGAHDLFIRVRSDNGLWSQVLTEPITVCDVVAISDFSFVVTGSQVAFTNESTGATSYEWDFGESNTSVEADPTHTYSNKGTYTVCLTATNTCNSHMVCHQVVIPNSAPTAISISDNTIDENSEIGTLVGLLLTTDADANDSHSYTLVAGTGDTNNDLFFIDGHQLKSTEIFDFETLSSYSIRLQTDDGDVNGTFEASLTISVNDVNEQPTALALSNNIVDENVSLASIIGFFTTTDPDNNETFTYAFSGDFTDNTNFLISGDQLLTNSQFDFESQNNYSIQITVTDNGGLTFNQQFTIEINDLNEIPVVENPISDINLDEDFGTYTIDISAVFSDPDSDVLTYSAISDSESVVTVSIYEAILMLTGVGTGTATITVTANDGNDGTVNDMFIANIIPTGIYIIEFGDIARIYPNPSKGIFYFELIDNVCNDLFVKIIDAKGQVIFSNSQITKSIEIIDLSNYTKGIYFIQLKSNKYSSTKKIILE
ncbi:MAG: PKD domain-containing protein [Salinivirgaceae bacterium]|nr:PKD domain-containing protein [Salinivirgaceae bacterium]